ncbi:MAG: hypothetical protein CMJ62_02825 [Planctomycetaceae bacterium]|nr:hypothetical protein [Planctomycetaceae bacterium]
MLRSVLLMRLATLDRLLLKHSLPVVHTKNDEGRRSSLHPKTAGGPTIPSPKCHHPFCLFVVCGSLETERKRTKVNHRQIRTSRSRDNGQGARF